MNGLRSTVPDKIESYKTAGTSRVGWARVRAGLSDLTARDGRVKHTARTGRAKRTTRYGPADCVAYLRIYIRYRTSGPLPLASIKKTHASHSYILFQPCSAAIYDAIRSYSAISWLLGAVIVSLQVSN